MVLNTRPSFVNGPRGDSTTSGPQGPAYHNEVPHPGSLSHERRDRAAARHKDDLDGVIVEQLVQVLGGLARVTLHKGEDGGVMGGLLPSLQLLLSSFSQQPSHLPSYPSPC